MYVMWIEPKTVQHADFTEKNTFLTTRLVYYLPDSSDSLGKFSLIYIQKREFSK